MTAAGDAGADAAGRQVLGRPPVMQRFRKRARQYARHPRFLRWAIRNRWHGLIFDPVGRYRCCGHTTPFHYQACPAASEARARAVYAALVLIAGDRCTNLTQGRCANEPRRSRDCAYGADRWCDACIAWDGLGRPEPRSEGS